MRAAENLLFVAGAAPLYYQAQYPTREAASAYAEERVASGIKELDANDLIYQLDASRNYNPWPGLERISVAADVDQFGRRFHQPAQPRRARSRR